MAVLGLSLDPSPRRRDLERRCGRLHRATVHALFSVAKMFSFINCPSAPKKAAPRGGLANWAALRAWRLASEDHAASGSRPRRGAAAASGVILGGEAPSS